MEQIHLSQSQSTRRCNAKGNKRNNGNMLPINYIISENDILCGRGSFCFNHPGNRNFHDIIQSNLEQYVKAKTKYDKSEIIYKVVKIIRSSTYGGNFIKEDLHTGHYYALSELQAREESSQAFRDMLNCYHKAKYSNVKATKNQTKKILASSISAVFQIDTSNKSDKGLDTIKNCPMTPFCSNESSSVIKTNEHQITNDDLVHENHRLISMRVLVDQNEWDISNKKGHQDDCSFVLQVSNKSQERFGYENSNRILHKIDCRSLTDQSLQNSTKIPSYMLSDENNLDTIQYSTLDKLGYNPCESSFPELFDHRSLSEDFVNPVCDHLNCHITQSINTIKRLRISDEPNCERNEKFTNNISPSIKTCCVLQQCNQQTGLVFGHNDQVVNCCKSINEPVNVDSCNYSVATSNSQNKSRLDNQNIFEQLYEVTLGTKNI